MGVQISPGPRIRLGGEMVVTSDLIPHWRNGKRCGLKNRWSEMTFPIRLRGGGRTLFTFLNIKLYIIKEFYMTKSELEKITENAHCIADICRAMNIKPKGSNYATVKRLLAENNIDCSHFLGRGVNKLRKGYHHKLLSDILENGENYNSAHLKERLINEGVKEYKCECCGNTEWLNEPIPLELHHINGNHCDNHLYNLMILCPNCHAKTLNYRRRNIGISELVTKDTDEAIKILKEKEEKRSEEIYANNIKYGKISKHIKKEKEKRYCEICGNEITGRGKRFCSCECFAESQRASTYDKDKILEQSKTVSSLIELGKIYDISDNAIKKHLKRLGIFEECVNNFISKRKQVAQYSIDGNLIKIWKDSGEASVTLNLSKAKINATCQGFQKTSGGYVWKYIN